MLILGIESSCDDAAAAVIETDRAPARLASAPARSRIRTTFIARYGGIVPELASRNHVVTIMPVIGARWKPRDAACKTSTVSR